MVGRRYAGAVRSLSGPQVGVVRGLNTPKLAAQNVFKYVYILYTEFIEFHEKLHVGFCVKSDETHSKS